MAVWKLSFEKFASGLVLLFGLSVLGLSSPNAQAGVENIHFGSPFSTPVVSNGYVAGGNSVNLTLGFAPSPGCQLMAVKNTGLGFIAGQFSNLAHGQMVGIQFNGIVYRFVANYYGGTGNDLVLVWQRQSLDAWGRHDVGQLGIGQTSSPIQSAAPVAASGVLQGKTVLLIATGGSHSLALCSDGKIAAWGNNANGELGDGSQVMKPVPVQVNQSGVLAGKQVVAIAAGAGFSLALSSEGKVYSWGSNSSGRLGIGSTSSRSLVPVAVQATGVLSGKSVVGISARGSHALALCSDGTLVAWGANDAGQLGYTGASSNAPVTIASAGALSGKSVSQIRAGNVHNLVLCSDGSLVAWGGNASGQLGNGSLVSSSVPVAVNQAGLMVGKSLIGIAAGLDHNLALASDGTLFAWGENGNGQLGIGTTNDSSVPVLPDFSAVFQGGPVVGFGAGGSHSMAIGSDGTTFTWGANESGQLGDGSTVQRLIPTQLNQATSSLATKTPVVISGGTAHSLALSALRPGAGLEGLSVVGGNLLSTVFPQSSTFAGLVPAGTATARIVPVAEDAAQVTVNGVAVVSGTQSPEVPLVNGVASFEIAITGEGGSNAVYHVDVAAGTTFPIHFYDSGSAPISASGFDPNGLNVEFALGFAPAVGTNLTVVRNVGASFIHNRFSNLASGQEVDLTFAGKTYRYVANYYGGPGNNDLVLEWANRSVVSWGLNTNGLGGTGGSHSPILVPVQVVQTGALLGKTVVSLSSSANSTLALCADGTLVGWGSNFYGQLGIGSVASTTVPVAINDFGALQGRRVIAAATGNVTSLALCADGGLVAWGRNSHGQLGDGTTTDSNIPVNVPFPYSNPTRPVVAIAVGGLHCIALLSDGAVIGWGSNMFNQLAKGTTPGGTSTPAPVSTSNNALAGKVVVAIGAGMYHNVALCSDGTLVAWGGNSSGQLGIGTTETYSDPKAVRTDGALAGKVVSSISVSSDNSLVLCSDSTLVAFGYGGSGQLGVGNTSNSNIPVAVNRSGVLSGRSLTLPAMGAGSSFVVSSDGTGFAWGSNSNGGLGDGTTIERTLPVEIPRNGRLFGSAILGLANGGSGHTHAIAALPDDGYVGWIMSQPEVVSPQEVADPDGDGITNLMEYVIGGNPSADSSHLLPRFRATGGAFVFEFDRNPSASAHTTQIFQYSTDLSNWSDLRISAPSDPRVGFGLIDTNGNEPVSVTVPNPSGTKVFGRLKVTRP